MARVTLDRLDQKLDDIAKTLAEAKAVMTDHIREDREMYTKVDRLDQNEQRRQWHIRTIWTTVIGAVGSIIALYLK